jgi:predicted RNA-binding Zn-ribbon protein involved in translation (DUF1610 family)
LASQQESTDGPQPLTAAVCGLFCSACTFYIGTHEDPKRLTLLATRMGVSEERLRCDGCRSDRRLFYCSNCHMFACAQERGLAFCGECPDSPCPELQAFVAERPHRADIYQDLTRIAEIGGDAWIAEATVRYTCPDCGTLNSAYDLKCRKCGRDPSNAYVAAHRGEIVAHLQPNSRPE